jgi:phosphoribosylformimino-5-aminoimidazole carboxamide ribotide isomerase
VFECIDDFRSIGLRHVLCTDVSRDGAMAGPNLQLYEDILARFPGLQLQASGGVRDMRDLKALRAAGLPVAIAGRALLDGKITQTEMATFQQSA